MKYSYKEIGERIIAKRKELGYNQYEFIDILDTKYNIKIGRNTLSKIENGDMPPQKISMALFIAMCDIFNCDIGYLLGEYNERTRNEKIIQEEIHLSNKAISNIKEHMFNSIKKAPVFNPFASKLNDLLSDENNPPVNQIETYINSLNLILEEYPELIAYIGRIILHNELNLYTDYIQRGNISMYKSYDIDKPLLNLVIKLKYYTENQRKLPTSQINNAKRYEYAIQFITKHMQALEHENETLHHCLISTTDYSDDDIYK